MPATAPLTPITFHVKLGNTEVTIKAHTLAELLDGTRLKKKELLELWKLNIRTYDKRHDHPGGITLDELFKLAAALKVPYLDIARLVYHQCEADPDARKAPVLSLE
ncbi:hypothetical protein [Hymenobacter sp. BRD67]|uniref:hypothetical protein n=1 Tax=Hymenobacter sp. BRD67 TaxID=2675877 RepID=UPI001566A328|nr:hypothetical protein [Hymenobacter sp. BRD67]QKG55138.1 hypothetical protein GKZ67_22225 [Hymenobacter sp. BRD67]